MKVMKANWIGIVAATALMFAGQAVASDATPAGRAIFDKAVCKGCHAIEYEGYGPAFVDVGAKYAGVAGAKESLIGKIKNGTKGTWGNNAMPPQKGNVTEEQLNILVDYILSLK